MKRVILVYLDNQIPPGVVMAVAPDHANEGSVAQAVAMIGKEVQMVVVDSETGLGEADLKALILPAIMRLGVTIPPNWL